MCAIVFRDGKYAGAYVYTCVLCAVLKGKKRWGCVGMCAWRASYIHCFRFLGNILMVSKRAWWGRSLDAGIATDRKTSVKKELRAALIYACQWSALRWASVSSGNVGDVRGALKDGSGNGTI